MAVIQTLSETVRSRIAAGEVIERPANVVKELVENAIDASASRIAVEITDGGKRLIRVTDDGEGMEKDDLVKSIQRHATSKIRDEKDIERILTLGFRGEALPSIGSVSTLTITTRTRDSDSGWRLTVIGGLVDGEPSPAACPAGTSVDVRGLFDDIPARLKFLGSSGSETTRIVEWLMRLALARPDIGFSLKVNGKLRMDAPPAERLADRVSQLYGRPLADSLLPVDFLNPDAAALADGAVAERLAGLIAPPDSGYHNRSRLLIFVNGRYIQDKSLIAAVSDAFRNRMPSNRFPVGFLHLELDPRELDVNVHPAKTEVRFLRSRFLFGFIRRAICEAIGEPPSALPNETPIAERRPAPFVEPKRPSLAPDFNAFAVSAPRPSSISRDDSPDVRRSIDSLVNRALGRSTSPVSPNASRVVEMIGTIREPVAETELTGLKPSDAALAHPASESLFPPPDTRSSVRLIGQALNRYIVIETSDRIELIDQHALHERVRFESMKAAARKGQPAVQPALLPETLAISPAQESALDELSSAFSAIGIDAEAVGGSMWVRSSPVGTSLPDAAAAVLAMIDEYLDTGLGTADPFRLKERAIYWASCKGAIKAGERLSRDRMESLLDDYIAVVGSGEWTCPHGRPISVRIENNWIEKQLDRR
ncbi:MAG: DNA mismatch repair endonuclease MutL [Planctomycetota bacterium]